jgi:hypothetical protein
VYQIVAAGGPTPTPTPTPTETPVGVSCPATPVPGCRIADKGILKIKEKGGTKDLLLWKWTRGAATTQTEMGADPVNGSTSYAVCVYDQSGGISSLAVQLRVDRASDTCAGKPCFKPLGGDPPAGDGWKYKDRDTTSDGMLRMLLKGGSAGKSKIIVKAKGPAIPLPGPVGGIYLNQDPNVVVQLVSSDGGVCFETTLSTPAKKNQADQFNDRL